MTIPPPADPTRPRPQTWLINLDRSTDRLETFVRINAALLPVMRFAAIDGRRLAREAVVAQGLLDPGLLDPGLGYTAGALGCALSHARLWELARDGGGALTVCEDDAIVHPSFNALAPALLDELPGGYDLVLWGWNFDSVLLMDFMPGVSPAVVSFDQARMRTGTDAFQQMPIAPRLFPLHRAFGTVCYTVSPQGAGTLLRACFPLAPLTVHFPRLNRDLPNTGIDIPMNHVYPSMRAYVCFPPLALTKNEHAASTVQHQPGAQETPTAPDY